MDIANAGEYVSFAILMLIYIYGSKHTRSVNVKGSLVPAFFIFIALGVFNIYEHGVLDTAKIIIFLMFIIMSYSYPKQALWILLSFLIITDVIDIAFISGYQKTTQIGFVFICTIFFLAKNYAQLQHRKTGFTILMIFILLEAMQGMYFSSRTTAVFSILLLFYLLFLPIKIQQKCNYWLVYLPFIYICGMAIYYKYAESYGLALSLSNVERSSMIMWCVDNLGKYFFVGPGVDSFIEGATAYKFGGIMGETPNDPHSVLMRIFITSGSLSCCLFFLFYIRPLRYLSLIKTLNPYVFILYLKVMLLLALGTYNASTRVIVGIGIGVLFNFISVSRVGVLKNGLHGTDSNNS